MYHRQEESYDYGGIANTHVKVLHKIHIILRAAFSSYKFLGFPRKIVEYVSIISEHGKTFQMYLEILREFCPAIGNTGVISVHFQIRFCFVFVFTGRYLSKC
jgi:hypothetical protein